MPTTDGNRDKKKKFNMRFIRLQDTHTHAQQGVDVLSRVCPPILTLAGTPRSTRTHSPAALLPAHHARPLGWCRRAYLTWQPASHVAG